MKKLIASTALALLGTLGFAGAVDAAPRKPVPLATACFYGSVKGPQCDAFPNAQNDWEGRVTPARWDPCSDNGTSTLLYITPCSRRSVTIAQWCTLHYDHHSRVFGKPCDRPTLRGVVTLRMELPIANADGEAVSVDDAVGLWTSILRLAAECGLLTENARCDFEGLANSPTNEE